RRADPPPASAIAGIESYFGLDPVTGRLIHVHTHYRLVVGGIWRTAYRLPIEEPLLASARPGAVFPVPAPEFELIAFAARMALRPLLALSLSALCHRVLTLSGRLKIIRMSGKHFAHGRTVIALLGGAGAGKSTCARELADCLSD